MSASWAVAHRLRPNPTVWGHSAPFAVHCCCPCTGSSLFRAFVDHDILSIYIYIYIPCAFSAGCRLSLGCMCEGIVVGLMVFHFCCGMKLHENLEVKQLAVGSRFLVCSTSGIWIHGLFLSPPGRRPPSSLHEGRSYAKGLHNCRMQPHRGRAERQPPKSTAVGNHS
jgi:hypothetical protein